MCKLFFVNCQFSAALIKPKLTSLWQPNLINITLLNFKITREITVCEVIFHFFKFLNIDYTYVIAFTVCCHCLNWWLIVSTELNYRQLVSTFNWIRPVGNVTMQSRIVACLDGTASPSLAFRVSRFVIYILWSETLMFSHIFVLFFFRINFEFFSSGNVVIGSICLSFILLKNVCNFILSFRFFF